MCHLFSYLKFVTWNFVAWVLWIPNGCKKWQAHCLSFLLKGFLLRSLLQQQQKKVLFWKSILRVGPYINPSILLSIYVQFRDTVLCHFSLRVEQEGQDECAAGTLLSTLCPPLFCTACTGGIIGTLNYLKTARAHYHKYSLDVLLRSTVRTRGSGCDFRTSRLCVCACVYAFWVPKGWLMDSTCKQDGFPSVNITECRQNEYIRLMHRHSCACECTGMEMSAPLRLDTLTHEHT